jgi:hypothetical protein
VLSGKLYLCVETLESTIVRIPVICDGHKLLGSDSPLAKGLFVQNTLLQHVTSSLRIHSLMNVYSVLLWQKNVGFHWKLKAGRPRFHVFINSNNCWTSNEWQYYAFQQTRKLHYTMTYIETKLQRRKLGLHTWHMRHYFIKIVTKSTLTWALCTTYRHIIQ